MKVATVRGAAVVAAAAVLLIAAPRPSRLVKIVKTGSTPWAVLERLQVDVAQELRTCYLARATTEEIQKLRGSGLTVSVLDRDVRGKNYLLVRDPGPAARSALERRGRVIALERGLLLFWSTVQPPDRALPVGLARKPVPGWSILPYLRPPSAAPPGNVSAGACDPVVEGILTEISAQNLKATVQSLQNFRTRFASTPQCEAAGAYLYRTLQGFALPTEYQSFNFGSGYSSRNVIAEVRGVSYPDDVLIICGHYDSTTQTSPTTLAPGADDNASGTAAVVEAARILALRRLDFTVRFIGFSAEEWGLYGSKAYASWARGRLERIVGVVNLDMIGFFAGTNPQVELYVNETSSWLGDWTARAASTYTTLKPHQTVDPSFVYSDHASFWDVGYPALLEIESGDNPYYHTPADTIDTLNVTYYGQTTRAALAVLAELAQPIRAGLPATPTGFSGRIATFSSLFRVVRKVTLSWDAVPGAAGYNVYRSARSHLDYERLTNAPLTTTTCTDGYLSPDASFFYVVRAVGTGGAESNPSREFEVRPAVASGAETGVPRLSFIRNGGRP